MQIRFSEECSKEATIGMATSQPSAELLLGPEVKKAPEHVTAASPPQPGTDRSSAKNKGTVNSKSHLEGRNSDLIEQSYASVPKHRGHSVQPAHHFAVAPASILKTSKG